MTDNYRQALYLLERAWTDDNRTHKQDMRDLATAQIRMTQAVVDELRAAAFMRNEAKLDADAKAMFTVHPVDTWTETQTTYTLVADAITSYIAARDKTDVLSPIDIRRAFVQARLAEYIAKALVGGESEQLRRSYDEAVKASEEGSAQWAAECEAVLRVLRRNGVTAPTGIADDILVAVSKAAER